MLRGGVRGASGRRRPGNYLEHRRESEKARGSFRGRNLKLSQKRLGGRRGCERVPERARFMPPPAREGRSASTAHASFIAVLVLTCV